MSLTRCAMQSIARIDVDTTKRTPAHVVTSIDKHFEYLCAVRDNQPETARRLWWEYLDLVAAEMAEKRRPKP